MMIAIPITSSFIFHNIHRKQGMSPKHPLVFGIHKSFDETAVIVNFSDSNQWFGFMREFAVSQDGLSKLGQWLQLFPVMTDVAMEATANVFPTC